MLGIADSYGVELRHPRRHGRAAAQLGKKGLSNHRWIAGGKLCVLVNQWGRVVAWADATANVHDSAFHPLIARFEGQTVVLADGNFHRKVGDPANLKVCRAAPGRSASWSRRCFSLLTRVATSSMPGTASGPPSRRTSPSPWPSSTCWPDWDGLREDEHGQTHLTIAQFSL